MKFKKGDKVITLINRAVPDIVYNVYTGKDSRNYVQLKNSMTTFHEDNLKLVETKEKTINYIQLQQQLRDNFLTQLNKTPNMNVYLYNLSQEEIDAILKEIETGAFKHEPNQIEFDFSKVDQIGDHNETMHNNKCTCGAESTFGSNATHSTWCDKK